MRDFWGFLLVLFLIAAVMRVDLFFYIFYLFAGLAIFTHWWTRRVLRAVSMRREYQDRAFLGEEVPVRLHVRNIGLLPIPWLRLHESLPLALISPAFVRKGVSLWPGEETTLEYRLDCRRRGFYRLGPLSMNAGDVFGFGETEAMEAAPPTLIVYPRVVPLSRLGLPSRSPFVSLPHRQRLFEDPARVRGVRPYQAGDSPRHIHWTASASAGELLVKQYEPSIALETIVLLNLAEQDYTPRTRFTASETGVTTAASILYHFTNAGQAVGLAVNGRDALAEVSLDLTPNPPTALPAGAVSPARGGGREVAGLSPPSLLRKGDGGLGSHSDAGLSIAPAQGQDHLMRLLEALARVEVAPAHELNDWARRVTSHLGWGSTVVLVTPVEPAGLADLLLHLKRAGFSVVLLLTQGPPSATAAQLGVPSLVIQYETDIPDLRQL